MRLESTGRVIDISCPFEGECFASMGCIHGSCPDTLLDVLRASALAEHELDMLPHTDPELQEVCRHVLCLLRRGEITVNQARASYGYPPIREDVNAAIRTKPA